MVFLRSESFPNGQTIPDRFAFCRPDPGQHATFSDNLNPHLAWGDIPQGTRSFVLLCTDSDAPTVGDDVNQEGRQVSADLPRADFHHWCLIDLPTSCLGLDEGACSRGVTAGGKKQPPGPNGSRQGLNDYTSWFADDPEMGGPYLGYDGPAPPWNDERVHRYHFTIHALRTEQLAIPAGSAFGVPEVLKAMEGQVLDSASWTGSYSLNPALRGD